MKVLLSPAKSLTSDVQSTVNVYSTPMFGNESDYLAQKLAKLSPKKIGDLMHLSDALAELNAERYANWVPPTKPSDVAKPCAYMFTGEVYKGLDFPSLDEESINVAQQTIRILSGLYGILKPLDLMYPYRLEMGTKWEITPKTKNLYSYWGTKIADALNAETSTDEVIVNLASNEYFKVVDKKTLKRKVITPIFKELKGDAYKVVMMYAKHARGAMARYIVENEMTDVELLKGYDVDGYRYHESLSDEHEWVFTR